MAQHAPSRLSKTRDRSELLREPEPVPRGEDFFKQPAVTSTSLDSTAHKHVEDEASVQEDIEERPVLDLSLPGSFKGSFSLPKRLAGDKEPIQLPLDIPELLIEKSPLQDDQEEAQENEMKSEVVKEVGHQVSAPTCHVEEEEEDMEGGTAAAWTEHDVDDDTSPFNKTSMTLFADMPESSGLILSRPFRPEARQEEEEEEEEEETLFPYPSLSEISVGHSLPQESGLPFSASVAAESTFLENANLQRWDLIDENQSDVELDNSFCASGKQNMRTLATPDAKKEGASRVSPFAPYIPSNRNQTAMVPKEADAAKQSGNQSVPAPRDQGTQSEGKSDNDKVNIGHLLEELAGGLTSSALMKTILMDTDLFKKDSANESTSANSLHLPTQPPRPASRQKSDYSHGSAFDERSSSEDAFTFDEGAGVGVGSQPRFQEHLESDSKVAEESSSEPSTPRFTAAEKGKQVDRGQFSTPFDHDLDMDGPPPTASLTDRGAQAVARAPFFSMLDAAPTDVPASIKAEQGVRGIYPAAPPAPWTSENSINGLSQRRSPLSTARSFSASTPNTNDPNLAFMSSARKHAPVTQPEAPGSKSLLSGFPDTSPQPVVSAQPVVALPEELLRGRYELPSIKKIDQWKSTNSVAPNAFRRLLINVGALVLSSIVIRGRFYRSVVNILSSILSPSIFYWTEWGVTLLLLFNITEVLYSYMRSSNNFEYLPLTPSQRKLLGLDPIVTKIPGAVPSFKKSTVAPQNLSERPMLSSYVSPSQGPFTASRAPFQKPTVGTAGPEYRNATTILNKSMARSFNQTSVQDKADLNRLMRNIEAREELHAEWKGGDVDPAKRPFGLHGGFGAPQSGLQAGVDMSVPDLLASVNARGPINRYQPALRTTLSKDHTSKADLQKDGLYVVGHSKVLKNLKVSEQQLDRWVFNMRKWLWNKIVMHVCDEMQAVDAELAKQGLSYLDCKSATMFYASVPQTNATNAAAAAAAAVPAAPAPLSSSLAWGAASVANTRLPSAFSTAQPQQPQLPTSLQDLEARYGDSKIVKQRLYLESYLAVPGCANRKYVVERLQAMGPLLTHFIWDSHGVTWDNGKKVWTADLPTDAQIIMHLFLTYIDTAMPTQPLEVYDRFLFTYKYYVPMENKPDATTALQIKQTSKNPPDYSLVVEGSMWEVVPKRLNVWYTLVLFVYLVMKENGGYLGQVNIGTQRIGLGDVVEGYDM